MIFHARCAHAHLQGQDSLAICECHSLLYTLVQQMCTRQSTHPDKIHMSEQDIRRLRRPKQYTDEQFMQQINSMLEFC